MIMMNRIKKEVFEWINITIWVYFPLLVFLKSVNLPVCALNVEKENAVNVIKVYTIPVSGLERLLHIIFNIKFISQTIPF